MRKVYPPAYPKGVSKWQKQRGRAGRWKIRGYCERCETNSWWDCREVEGTEEHICATCGTRKEYKTI